MGGEGRERYEFFIIYYDYDYYDYYYFFSRNIGQYIYKIVNPNMISECIVLSLTNSRKTNPSIYIII